jgi:hypothetical protein
MLYCIHTINAVCIYEIMSQTPYIVLSRSCCLYQEMSMRFQVHLSSQFFWYKFASHLKISANF